VKLYCYDLTNGMAAMMGPSLLGRPLEAVWHTSIVAFGTEYFYGQGIMTSIPVSSGSLSGFLFFFPFTIFLPPIRAGPTLAPRARL